MVTTTEDFRNSFHQISGTTYGERQKNLFVLLNNIKQNDAQIDFDSIVPQTPLEETFKIKIFLHFGKIPKLIEVLKSENPLLIQKVLNEQFVIHLLEYVTETRLVEEYFPQFSFSTKVKLINKLSVCLDDEKRGDVLFNAIEKKYGFYLATKLLPCCSADLILRCAQTLKFELTPRQFLFIVKKRPELTVELLRAFGRYVDNDVLTAKYKIVFIHVLRTDLQLFWELQKEYQCYLRVGWRATRKVVAANKDSVAKDAVTFYKYLHCKQITKSFGTEFFKFYVNMFPPSLSRFKENVSYYVDLLEHLPGSVSKLNCVLTAFQEKYGTDWTKAGCVHKSVLELMSVDQRESWMNAHAKPDYVPEEVWICLMKIDKSIPALKQRLSATHSINDKSELIGCLVETCRINDDDGALLHVLKYVWTKYRNSNSAVILSFLSTLEECYKTKTLNDSHWKFIMKLVYFCKEKEGIYYSNDWFLSYINYLTAKDQLDKEQFVSIMKNVTYGSVHSSMKRKEHQKKCLIIFGDVLSEVYESEELKDRSFQFLHDVLRWNHQHTEDKVSLAPYQSTVDNLRESSSNYTFFGYLSNLIVVQILLSDASEQSKADYLDAVFKTKNIFIDVELPLWLLKNSEEITKALLSLKPTFACVSFWRSCGNYTHLNIPQRITQFCLDRLKDEGESKKSAVVALSCLMQPLAFLELIGSYYPSDLRMDVNSDGDDQDTYQMQQGIMIALKNVIPPSVTFDAVLHFSKGDYMKFIQRTLHSICQNSTENRISGFLPLFRNHPVSVRKHAIFHTFRVLDKAAIFAMLNEFKKTEKNSSILKVIFKGTFNYFGKNPNEETFALVQQHLRTIDVSDEEGFEILLNIKKVPFMYLPQYLVFTYGVFEEQGDSAKLNDARSQVLNAVSPEVITKLSEEAFSLRVISQLFKACGGFEDGALRFSCRFLAYGVDDPTADIFGFVKSLICSSWSQGVVRKGINSFVHQLCLTFIQDRKAPKQRLETFVNLWNDCLKPHEAFHEYLEMYFTLSLLNGRDVTESVLFLCGNLSEYDHGVVFDVAQVLGDYLGHFLQGADDVFEMNRLSLVAQLVESENKLGVLLGVLLLPASLPDNFQVVESYKNVLQLLKQFKDPIICLSLSSYLYSCSNTVIKEEEDFTKHNRYHSWFFRHVTNKYRQQLN